jgi:ABC-type bacteriocin/lantibiotic exporter with double-glycine peptidase domain
MKRFAYVLSSHKLRFAKVLVLGLSLNATFALVEPLMMKLLIDEGLVKRNFRLFAVCAALVVVFGAAARGASLAYQLLSERLRNIVTQSLTLRMLRAYYATPYAQITRFDTGYFVSRVYDEPAKVSHGVVTAPIGVLVSAVTLVVGFGISLFLAWRITLALSIVVPALYYVANRFSPRIKAASERENEEEARLRDLLGRSIDGYKTVRIFALDQAVYRRVSEQLRTYLSVLYGCAKTSGTYQTLSRICLSGAEALVLMAAGYEVVTGRLTIGGLFAFMNAFWKVIHAATDVVSQVPELSRLAGSIDRLTEFERAAPAAARSQAPDIQLESVDFRYDGNRAILGGLNLRVARGERVLIAGPNGSGKTTLGHVIAGFLEPSAGIIRTPTLERISAMLAPFHFAPGSLRDNVGYEGLSREQVDVFDRLVRSFGLESRVDADASSELSEGEKKKCQVVMTLLKDADIYLVDEPLANIDVDSRDAVMHALLTHTRGKMLIAIMHGDEKYHQLFDRVVALKGTGAEAAGSSAGSGPLDARLVVA